MLRKGGVDDVNGLRAAWRDVFPLYVGEIPNADEHAIEGSRWTEFETRVEPGDQIVQTKKRLSVFLPDRSRLPAAQHGGPDGGAERRVHRLLRGSTPRSTRATATTASSCCRTWVRGTNDEMEEAALKMVSIHMGLVMDSADLLAQWSAQIEPRLFDAATG